jgi:predicted ATP-grasp superfamily ATP-dependent carboligase
MPDRLLLLGASTRAAAFSALRAGLQPWCADLFADVDLVARCPVVRIDSRKYPHGFLDVEPPQAGIPWMYTGALENRPTIIGQLARRLPLWGNRPPALRRARSPQFVAGVLRRAGLPHPRVQWPTAGELSAGRWLVKPLASGGGSQIRVWGGGDSSELGRKGAYCQEFLAGESCAAVYVGDGRQAVLLGATTQLVGQAWLHAPPFHYCGSVGPPALDASSIQGLELLGNVLAAECRLRGLFGIDCILREGVPYPVEINPRYTASVEVLEYAKGIRALALHRRVFDPFVPVEMPAAGCPAPTIGKAILFARERLDFPADGPWMPTVRSPESVDVLPAFADIPRAGEDIRAGRPILTMFAAADTVALCLEQLRQIAADLDHWLFGK